MVSAATRGAKKRWSPADPQGLRAAQVQVRVVLPGVADSAEHLDAVTGDGETGFGAVAPATAAAREASSAPTPFAGVSARAASHSTDAGLLGESEHPGSLVLDTLELTDRAAELLTHLRVVGRSGHRPVGQTRRLGREQGCGDVEYTLAVDVEDLGGGEHQSVDGDLGITTHDVVAGQVGDLEPVASEHHETAVPCASRNWSPTCPPRMWLGLTV